MMNLPKNPAALDQIPQEWNPNLEKEHFQEWLDSGVAREIIKLNVTSLSGDEPYEYLLYGLPNSERRNDGRLRDKWLYRYRHTEEGGWYCSGGIDTEWGCFKPDKPRIAPGKGKVVKYEHPPQTPTEIFQLKITWEIGLKIAKRNGKGSKYVERVWQQNSQTKESQKERKETPKGFSSTAKATIDRNRDRDNRDRGRVLPTNNISPIEEAAILALGNDEDKDFWKWMKENREVKIILTEGAKKAGALLSAGYCAIALPGIWGAYRKARVDELGQVINLPKLIPQLEPFCTEGREIYFAFDQDEKPKTRKNVEKAIANTARLLSAKGCIPKIIEWKPELGKGADDLIVTHGQEIFDQQFQQGKKLEDWKAKGLIELTYEPSLELNQRYLGEFGIPDWAKLIGLKAPKGTGKTEWICNIAQQTINQGQKVLILGHRNQLVEELCNRFGIDHITKFRNSETKGIFGIGLCVDSLHDKSQAHFNPEDWEDALIIVDEAEQVFWHLLNAKTSVKNNRVTILENLKNLFRLVTNSDEGKIILSDADLCNISIDYVRGLIGVALKPYLVVNHWKPEHPWQINNFDDGAPANLVKNLMGHIKEGGKPFICVSAQKPNSKWSSHSIEGILNSEFPDKKFLRIDSGSVSNPEHPAYGCIDNLNSILREYDGVICTSVVETGVSIDLKGHFTSVWGIFQGNLTTDSARQFLARLREEVPRYIWCAKRGLGFIANGSTSVKSILANQHKSVKANKMLLEQAWGEDDDGNSTNHSLITWAKRASLHNLQKRNYRATILEELENEGHLVQNYCEPLENNNNQSLTEKEIKDKLKVIAHKNYTEECQEISQSQSPTELEYNKLKDKRAKTKTERHQERKGDLERRYLTREITPDLVIKDDQGWCPRLKLNYYLTIGKAYLQQRDKQVAQSLVEKGKGKIYKPDFNNSLYSAQAKCLELLGINELLDPTKSWTQESAKEIADRAKKYRWDVQTYLGVTVTDKSKPIEILQRLLDKVGRKLKYEGRFGSRGQRQRFYRLQPPEDGREEVFKRWFEYDEAKAMSKTCNKNIRFQEMDTGA